MFKFKVDYKQAGEVSGLLPKGEYEVFAKQEKGFTSRNGTMGTEFIFVVRRDVDQKGGGKHIWHTFWHTENTMRILQAFVKALGIPEGVEYDSREAFAQDVLMRPVRAVVGIEEYEHNGTKKKKNVIKFFKASEYRDVAVDFELHKKDLESTGSKPKQSVTPAAPSLQKVTDEDPFADNDQPFSEDEIPFL